jgi:hypothetical protein
MSATFFLPENNVAGDSLGEVRCFLRARRLAAARPELLQQLRGDDSSIRAIKKRIAGGELLR